ncbi:DUF4364 family protein [Clostridium sp. Sa3CUN1]|uniref:DUF4364 family protein n=1 Tax=Clostridium gallinarum TaxID=2762246 RepID=A0ABR8PZU2_9CLOT|nr:DUF4364 family protein [Clostridium gallinarum]MBD7913694.1 DUF4364 family protein [Clostridium gallinarum]
MYENSAELAENKLLVLYVMDSLKHPITNTQLTEIILENNFINYFTLQQYISELISSDFLRYEKVNDKNLVHITEKGTNTLSLFSDRISTIKKKIIDDYLHSMLESIKKELTIHSDYTIGKDNSFIVDLQALENDNLLISLKVSVPTKKQATSLSNRWKDNPSDIYNKIMNSLFSDDN